MAEENKQYFENYTETVNEIFDAEPFYQEFVDKLKGTKNSFYMYNKRVEKNVDMSWIEAIEDSIVALDTAIRNPRKYMEIREELLPMELSKNITPDSVKHLAQHTNLINSITDEGMIIPTKIMNYIKEESIQTYENKFVNTLVDRLYNFVERRYKKICDTSNDDNIGVVQFDTKLMGEDPEEYVSMKFIVEAHQKAKSESDSGKDDIVQRVEKLRNIILDFKLSPFVKSMGDSYIRPPVMRTNAILKDPNYKQCLICWQFIESYDKVGYSVDIHESTQKPSEEYIDEIYKLSAMNYGVFKHFMEGTLDKELILKERHNRRKITPKFIKRMVSNVVNSYDVSQTEFQKILSDTFKQDMNLVDSASFVKVQSAIERAIKIEKDFHDLEQKYIRDKKREAEERKRQALAEERRKKLEKIQEEARKRRQAEEEEERRKQAAIEEEQRKIREAEEAKERKRQAIIIERARIEREAEEQRQREIEERRQAAKAVGSFVSMRKRSGNQRRR